jgi:hypothetical protein
MDAVFGVNGKFSTQNRRSKDERRESGYEKFTEIPIRGNEK